MDAPPEHNPTYAEQRRDWMRSRRERRNQTRLARLRRQVLRYFLLSLLLAAGISIFAYVGWAPMNFDRDVVVHGNQVVTRDHLRTVMAPYIGVPLYRLNPQPIEQSIKSLEAVRFVFVRRYLLPRPHLAVEILEEYPWASFATAPESPNEAVIAQTGKLIPVARFPLIVQPELRVFGQRDLKLTTESVTQWATWASYIAAQTNQKVEFFDLRQSSDIRAQSGDLYLRLGTANNTLTKRLGRLSSVIPELGPVRDKLEYIDLTIDNNIPLKICCHGHNKLERMHPMPSSALQEQVAEEKHQETSSRPGSPTL
ncbi:MAG: FtsQ-type POTRA domain-containing protein [Candidatus Obscuribacterales bacterium]|nr:FtsQ-type POTRA domain-containing protein [Candidatus Obscuribacterales bacterium]